jgi:hypothetical protein
VRSLRRPRSDPARILCTCWAAASLFVGQLNGLTLDELRNDPDLTPRKLMSRVSRFKYELHAEVQKPEDFLAAECGDCDDFAIMAAAVLREKGYTTRLIAVRMPGLTHVVCYVPQTGQYMDYNNRIYFRTLVKCKPDLNEIADRVSKSFDSSWTTASEFVYTNQVKVMVSTIARAESFSRPTVSNSPPANTTNRPPVRQLDISF